MTPSALTVLSAKGDEETSDRLDGQDASRPLSVDGEAVPGSEQAPTQGRPPCRSAPDLSAVREGDLSDRLHQQDDRGLVCPPCKVHGELVRLGGPSAWSCCIPMHVCAYVCVCVCVCVEHNCELATATCSITAPTPPTAVSQFEVVSPVLPVSPGRQIDWTVDS